MTRHVAICVFYDQDLNIFVQERGSASKVGEKYGFWGGQLKEGETPEVAMRRELLEELDYEPKDLRYWGNHSGEGFTVGGTRFLVKLKADLQKQNV